MKIVAKIEFKQWQPLPDLASVEQETVPKPLRDEPLKIALGLRAGEARPGGRTPAGACQDRAAGWKVPAGGRPTHLDSDSHD